MFRTQERYDEHKSPLAPLSVGDSVSVQNREGNKPLRWDKTGQVVERLENKQYLVKNDGSGRVMLRTRGHLRKIKPCTRSSWWPDVYPAGQEESAQEEVPLHIPGGMDAGRVFHLVQGHEEVHQVADNLEPGEPARPVVEQGQGVQKQAEEVVREPRVRRSQRARKEKKDKDFL